MDYASMKQREAWLRHPVLGDPSFDTFKRIGDAVHTSEEPYEWGVNGSLFRDPKEGHWYLYAGLYPHGYALKEDYLCHCVIYRSVDEGASWASLGPIFEKGFVFDCHDVPSDICPDVVVTYDLESDIYWASYDWVTNNSDWENIFRPVASGTDSGAALAWSKSPAGPFTRLPMPHIRNALLGGRMGRFKRMYASTLLKREKDWISLVLCDSSEYFSWGLACLTAPSPEGPWSDPIIVLSVDRPEYYPAPVEFYPCFVEGNMVYAPATSVAASRNYQAIFAADLEEAEKPESWCLVNDGNVWHSRPSQDEKYGIWGQTIHGFVHDGDFRVMYPCKDHRDFGTLFVASRPWDAPYQDGFTFSGHQGKAVSPLLAAYSDFQLSAEFEIRGTIDFAFDYDGILGPDRNISGSIPHQQTLAAYSALRISEDRCFKLITVDRKGNEHVYDSGRYEHSINAISIQRTRDRVIVFIADTPFATAEIPCMKAKPLAIIAHEFSHMDCSKFEVLGDAHRYEVKYNGYDALLGAGQRIADWEVEESQRFLSQPGLIGKEGCKAKWNILGDSFDLYAPTSPEFGTISVYVDGVLSGQVDLHSHEKVPSAIIFSVNDLKQGPHSVLVNPDTGKFALDLIAVRGDPKRE